MDPSISFTSNASKENNTIINSNNSIIIDDNMHTNLNNESNSEVIKDFNNKSFKLNDKNSDIYIIQNQLFTRTLLSIQDNKDREMLVKCTM